MKHAGDETHSLLKDMDEAEQREVGHQRQVMAPSTVLGFVP